MNIVPKQFRMSVIEAGRLPTDLQSSRQRESLDRIKFQGGPHGSHTIILHIVEIFLSKPVIHQLINRIQLSNTVNDDRYIFCDYQPFLCCIVVRKCS